MRSGQRDKRRGVSLATARRIVLGLEGVEEARSYGMPAFKVNGRFFARFRDDDSVLVLQLATIDERAVLMKLDPDAFFFTDHYRDYPAVLIRLASVPEGLLDSVVGDAHSAAKSRKPPRPQSRPSRTRKRTR